MPYTIQSLVVPTNIPVAPNIKNGVEDTNLIGIKKAVSYWLKHEKKYTKHTWFHNHEDPMDPDYQHQGYPFIQYRACDGFLQFYAVQDGVEVMGEVMSKKLLEGFQFKQVKFNALAKPGFLKPKQHTIRFAPDGDKLRYAVNDFIAINDDNLKIWKQPGMTAYERMDMLQEQLANSLAMFCKECGCYLDKNKLQVSILWVWETRRIKLMGERRAAGPGEKGQRAAVMAFTIEFESNLDLPDGIAIGRAAKIGYGWISRKGKILEAL